jgi:hypothetical protein
LRERLRHIVSTVKPQEILEHSYASAVKPQEMLENSCALAVQPQEMLENSYATLFQQSSHMILENSYASAVKPQKILGNGYATLSSQRKLCREQLRFGSPATGNVREQLRHIVSEVKPHDF